MWNGDGINNSEWFYMFFVFNYVVNLYIMGRIFWLENGLLIVDI